MDIGCNKRKFAEYGVTKKIEARPELPQNLASELLLTAFFNCLALLAPRDKSPQF